MFRIIEQNDDFFCNLRLTVGEKFRSDWSDFKNGKQAFLLKTLSY